MNEETVLRALTGDIVKCCSDNNLCGLSQLLKHARAHSRSLASLFCDSDGSKPHPSLFCASDGPESKAAVSSLVRLLFAHKSLQDVDGLGCASTPLHIAAKKGHEDVCIFLATEAELRYEDLTARTSRGLTPKSAAARSGWVGVVALLGAAEKELIGKKTGIQQLGTFVQKSEDMVRCVDSVAKRRKLVKSLEDD